MADSTPSFVLKATYNSPTNEPFVVSNTLAAPASAESTKDRTTYLGVLRKATAEMQDQINKELTMRMEQDKAREAEGNGGVAAKKGIDEKKEEDNYGEEIVEED
ncbi:hypothetical protein BP5796_06533 [Coleophoma crateriformis]|uniref:EKC/KEOPS complex subunit GON7 n=1 Tax=Coleophoma crateriformis TaxID=565419 RepID=A0A3D8RNP2_9HELO|nr:hypothetical protein BP5796_06533 [Coleophoma crateriformis]